MTLHERAVFLAGKYRAIEGELVEVLIEIDEKKIYGEEGHPSLHVYIVQELKLSEGNAYAFMAVARKTKQVPELKKAIKEGVLNLSQARCIVSVIEPLNPSLWIEKAANLPQKELEKEVAKANPDKNIRERIRPVCENLSELRVGLSHEEEALLKRVQDVLCKKLKKPVSLRQAIKELSEEYLKRNDPIEKAKRNLSFQNKPEDKPETKTGRIKLPAQLVHQVNSRDKGLCQKKDKNGIPCHSSRWPETHHIKLISQGGTNTLDNLITLCSGHHKTLHLNSPFPMRPHRPQT